MTVEQAKQIIEETQADYRQKQRVLRGLQILAKYESDITCSFEHDVMYAGDFETAVAQMSEDEVKEMALLGWFEEYDSWTHY